MTQVVNEKAPECGKNENSHDGIITCHFNGNVEHNKFDFDDIKGVHVKKCLG